MAHWSYKLKFAALCSKVLMGVDFVNLVFSIIFYYSAFNTEEYVSNKKEYLDLKKDVRDDLSKLGIFYMSNFIFSMLMYCYVNYFVKHGVVSEKIVIISIMLNVEYLYPIMSYFKIFSNFGILITVTLPTFLIYIVLLVVNIMYNIVIWRLRGKFEHRYLKKFNLLEINEVKKKEKKKKNVKSAEGFDKVNDYSIDISKVEKEGPSDLSYELKRSNKGEIKMEGNPSLKGNENQLGPIDLGSSGTRNIKDF